MCENLHYESVYFKELHNEQEYYWPTIYRAGAAVVSTITSYNNSNNNNNNDNNNNNSNNNNNILNEIPLYNNPNLLLITKLNIKSYLQLISLKKLFS